MNLASVFGGDRHLREDPVSSLAVQDIRYNQDDIICSLATGWGRSALAVIRASGSGTIDALKGIFSNPNSLGSAAGYSIVYGHILSSSQGAPVDEVLVSIFHDSEGYTGEESAEISCHGGTPAIQGVLEALRGVGFRDAAPGEFTLRAFLNGKIDLTRAEAVQEIVSAKTDHAHSLALGRLSGSVERRIKEINDVLVHVAATLEVQLDYPEEEIDQELPPVGSDISRQKQALSELSSSYRTGKLYQEGVRVALTGETNSGKSSLFNRLLGEERAITSEQHGTTRDYLEGWISLNNIPICLIDTAGFRSVEDTVEQEGIRRSTEIRDAADLVIHLIDATKGISANTLVGHEPQGTLWVWNKMDACTTPPPDGVIPVSALTGEGLERLQRAMEEAIVCDTILPSDHGDVVIDSARQKHLLDSAVAALTCVEDGLGAGVPLDGVAVDLRSAINLLGEITGEITSADILEEMFSGFCLGK